MTLPDELAGIVKEDDSDRLINSKRAALELFACYMTLVQYTFGNSFA